MVAQKVLDYKNIITDCFATDPELLEKWHICSPASLEHCVENTINALKQNQVSVYKLTINEKVIGYFGQEYFNNQGYLTGFFIKPEYRTKEYILEFWNILNHEFNNKPYYCGIYKINTPALKFLQRAGGIQAWENSNGSVFIMMNWSK